MTTTSPSMLDAVEDYLRCRRSLGFELKIEGQELLRYARFADSRGHHGPSTTELAFAWAQSPHQADSIYRARRLDMVRRFARHRAQFDPQTEVPPEGVFGPSYRRRPPYIYSPSEIEELLCRADELGPKGGLRPKTYKTLLGLLACTGIRISEALNLTVDDVDLRNQVITIRKGKFRKCRLVPIHHSVTDALSRYGALRDSYLAESSTKAFFRTERGTSQKYHKTLLTFIKLREALSWRERTGRPPRMHDLRHYAASGIMPSRRTWGQ